MKFKYYKEHSLALNTKWIAMDSWREVKNFFVRMKYHYNGGYLCHECNAKIPIYYSEISSYANHKYMLISNHGNHLYCPHCLAEKLDAFMLAADLDDEKCDWYPASNKTIGIIGQHFGSIKNQALAIDLDLNVRFGSSWWNGHHASRNAFLAALLSDKLSYSTGMSNYINGKVYMTDRHGIQVERKGF